MGGRTSAGGIRLAVVGFVALLVAVALVGVSERSEISAWLARRLNPIAYTEEICAAAAERGLDPYLVLAVVKAESGFRADATSAVGARGLMQLMPATANWIAGQPDWTGPESPDLENPAHNLALGCYYLRFLLDRYGDEATALAAYNAGQGVVDSWLAGAGSGGGSARAVLSVDRIPYPDTQDFVRRVLHYQELYTRIYPEL